MIKLINPKTDNEDAECFACSPHNAIGLKMEFYEKDDKIISFWEPDKNYEGFNNVLHGGIQATLIDETAAWSVFVKGATSGVTKSLEIQYINPVYINKGKIRLEAVYTEEDNKHARINVDLIDHKGRIATTGQAIYTIYPQKIARKKMNYPGVNAYYPEK